MISLPNKREVCLLRDHLFTRMNTKDANTVFKTQERNVQCYITVSCPYTGFLPLKTAYQCLVFQNNHPSGSSSVGQLLLPLPQAARCMILNNPSLITEEHECYGLTYTLLNSNNQIYSDRNNLKFYQQQPALWNGC